MNQTFLQATFAAGLLLSVGCKPDAVVNDIGINLNIKNADLDANNVLITEKNIATEQGNPYGAFLSDIAAQLGGEPAVITLEAATLTLVGGDQTTIEELYVGAVTLTIVDDAAGTETDIATITDPLGVGPLELTIDSDAFDDEAFQATLNDGSFKMRVTGAAADAAANINADVALSLSFSANE
jgi:hypothetical protein